MTKMIDLGAASIETRGLPPFQVDNAGIGRPEGMSDAD